ncbi:MAG: hypothetical protein H6Q88_420 [Anaeromyxobacteraceae bacterium]|nr:hypothetical protein [Anaeromyxobacteraceae bacterium]
MKTGPGCRLTPANPCAQKEQMTTNSTGWKNWSSSTRLFIGIGGAVAVAVLVFLYTA